MAVAGRQVLGVDINPYKIAVVEMRGAWPNGHILRADVVNTPRGALNETGFVDPGAIADALRGLLERMGVGTQEAVIGVAARHVVTRVLEVPSVPDNELKMVIEGELAHYQILSSQSASIDFLRLQELNDRPGAIPQVLAVAADQKTIGEYTSVADLAGLKVLALEPSLSGMYRAAYLQLEAHPASVCIAIGSTESEIAIVDGGQIRLHRRIDIGSDDLIQGRGNGFDTHFDPPMNSRNLVDMQEPSPPPFVPASTGLVSENAEYLATELRRSIDYYRTQRPDSAAITGAVIAVDDPALEQIATILAEVVGVAGDIARLPVVWAASRGLAGRLEPPGDLQFLTAAGLAMHELANPPFALPRFDLSTRQRVDPKVEYSRKRLSISLALSILCIAGGIYGGGSFGMRARAMDRELQSAKSTLAALDAKRKQQTETIEMQVGLLTSLRRQGFPLARIVDSIARNMGSECGLTELALTETGEITAGGEAGDDRGVLQTLDGMKASPYLLDTALQSFNHVASQGKRAQVIKFQITSQLVGTGSPVPAPAKSP